MRISQGSAHNEESDLKTYWHINTVHVHILSCHFVEGRTWEFSFETKLLLRYMALCNHLCLLLGLNSFLIMVKVRIVIGGNVRFNNALISHKKLCLVNLVKWTLQQWRGLLCSVSSSLSSSITSLSSSTTALSINCLILKVSAHLPEDWSPLVDMSWYSQVDDYA